MAVVCNRRTLIVLGLVAIVGVLVIFVTNDQYQDYGSEVRSPVIERARAKSAIPEVDIKQRPAVKYAVPEIDIKQRTVPKKFCDVYNLSAPLEGEAATQLQCVNTSLRPSYKVCVYSPREDQYISKTLIAHGQYEAPITKQIVYALAHSPSHGFIDVGGNIGYYSQMAASTAHKVVAIEPFQRNIARFHRAVALNKMSDQITLVRNAISDSHTTLHIQTKADNQGGTKMVAECLEGSSCNTTTTTTIVMDDLLEVVTFDRAVMKIDVEGHEARAFVTSRLFMEKVELSHIFMEWVFFQTCSKYSIDPQSVEDMVRYFTDAGYKVYPTLFTVKQLNPKYWVKWPNNVVWCKPDSPGCGKKH